MAPPGHIAAGYLTAEAVLRTFHFNISATQYKELLGWGMFFGFAPDLDFFWAFYKARKFRIDLSKANHRKYILHAPILWLLAGGLTAILARTDFLRAFGLILWLASWSHFILDSEWGIMWLWPLSDRLYPFSQDYYQKKIAKAAAVKQSSKDFWKYWWNFAKSNYFSGSGSIEIFIIIVSLIIYVSTTSYR